ncbi:hypothetical protein ACHAQH_001907 [Verticillium albo-atrum]
MANNGNNHCWESNGQDDINYQLSLLNNLGNTPRKESSPNTYTGQNCIAPQALDANIYAGQYNTTPQVFNPNFYAGQGYMTSPTFVSGDVRQQGSMPSAPNFLQSTAQDISSPFVQGNNMQQRGHDNHTQVQTEAQSLEQRRAESNAAIQKQRQAFALPNSRNRNKRCKQAQIQPNLNSRGSVPAVSTTGVTGHSTMPVADSAPVDGSSSQIPDQQANLGLMSSEFETALEQILAEQSLEEANLSLSLFEPMPQTPFIFDASNPTIAPVEAAVEPAQSMDFSVDRIDQSHPGGVMAQTVDGSHTSSAFLEQDDMASLFGDTEIEVDNGNTHASVAAPDTNLSDATFQSSLPGLPIDTSVNLVSGNEAAMPMPLVPKPAFNGMLSTIGLNLVENVAAHLPVAAITAQPPIAAVAASSAPASRKRKRSPQSVSPAIISESSNSGGEAPARKRRGRISSAACKSCRHARKGCFRHGDTHSCVRCYTSGKDCNMFSPDASQPIDGRTTRTARHNHEFIYDEARSVIEKLWKTLTAIVPSGEHEAPELVKRRLALARSINARMPQNNVESWVPITDIDIEALELAAYRLDKTPDCLNIIGGGYSYVERPQAHEKLADERQACHATADKASLVVGVLIDCIGFAADPINKEFLSDHVAGLHQNCFLFETHTNGMNPLSLAFKKHLDSIINNVAGA